MRQIGRAYGQRLNRPARGQVLPLVAGAMMAFLLFATLLIDGAMMMQARRDLEIIAEHAANVGAQQVNFNAFPASCPGTGSPTGCEDRFRLNVSQAMSRASSTATNWLNRNETQALSLPGFAPSGGSVIVNRTNRNQAVVTLRRCYEPFLINIFTRNNGDGCRNATLIEVTAIARPIGGN